MHPTRKIRRRKCHPTQENYGDTLTAFKYTSSEWVSFEGRMVNLIETDLQNEYLMVCTPT